MGLVSRTLLRQQDDCSVSAGEVLTMRYLCEKIAFSDSLGNIGLILCCPLSISSIDLK